MINYIIEKIPDGIVPFKGVLARLCAGMCGAPSLTEVPEDMHLKSVAPDSSNRMKVAEAIMCEDHDILYVLAQ